VNYDVVIAGGSVAGLLCAREIASNRFSVLVILVLRAYFFCDLDQKIKFRDLN